MFDFRKLFAREARADKGAAAHTGDQLVRRVAYRLPAQARAGHALVGFGDLDGTGPVRPDGAADSPRFHIPRKRRRRFAPLRPY